MAADESGTEKAMAAPAAEPEKRHWFDEMDEIEWEDDGDIERLPCSLGYVITCLLLPFFNGCINGFAASSVGLYFKDMDWALWRLGLALLVGFSMRLITQRIQVRFGIWSALPMATFHLIGAILAVLFTAEEWAIFTEIVCLCAFDSSMAIEGIAYDTFKDDPEVTDMARQVCLCAFDSSMAIEGIAYDTFKDDPEVTDMATSTSLGVFTVSMALACTAGGIIYDAYRWQGLSIFHCSCQGSLFLLLLISPTCRQSFMAYWFGDPDEEDVDDDDDDGISMKDLQVQPNSPNVSPTKSSAEEIKREANALEQKLPGQSDLVLEDVEDPSGVSKVSVSEEAPNRQVSFSEAPEAANRQVSFSEAPEAASRNVSFSEAPEAANRNVSFSEAPKAADAPEEDEEEEQKPEGNKVGKVSTVSEASGGSPKAGKVAKASSRVTFGAEEVQTMEQDLAVVMVKAPDIPAAEEDATSATADEGEIVIGVDYDQVDDLKKVFDQQDEDALTPTSRLNVWNKNGNKKGLILTHLSYEETADEHLVSSGEGDGSPSRHARGSHARGSHFSGRGSMASARASRMSRASGRASRASRSSRASQVSSMSRASRMSGASRVSHISRTSEAIMRVSRTARASRRRASGRRASELSINSDESGKSNMTLRSQMTSLAEAGTNFEHHFLVNNTLGPQIVTKTGQDDVEDDFGEGEPPLEDIPWAARGTIHPGSRLPLFLICLCGLVNSFCYATEFGTFAVLYREYYGISDATTAALCQTAGDFVAALSMQINTFSAQFKCCRGCVGLWQKFAFAPYNLSWALFIWILLSLSMISGVFPLAVLGQILMSCTYCLTSKFSSELIFFYSRGDLKAFMKLQVYVKSSEALAAAFANFFGLFLLEAVNPWVPYLVCSCMSFVVFVIYTNIFCGRLSCRDIVVAEEKRLNAGI